jgi:hypothetical protein
MGTITLSFTNNSVKNKQNKQNKVKKEKVLLTYHMCVEEVPEYFTYMDGHKEKVFDDHSYMINKISSTKYIAKKNYVSKIPLTYVAAQENIESQPEYFTYNDNEIYLDKPIYNEETNTYTGVLEVVDIYDKEIELYEDKN